MNKQTFILVNANVYERAAWAVKQATEGYVVTIQEPTRTLEQNSKFHSMCGDIAKSPIEWAGKRRSTQQWKVLLVSGHAIATKIGSEMVPGLEGEFVNLRESTASMGVKRLSSLIEYTYAWGSNNEVIWTPEKAWGYE